MSPPLILVRLHVIHKRLMRYCFNLVYHRPTRLLLRDIYLCVCLLCMTGVKEFAKLFFALPQMFNFFPREYICNLFSDAFRAYQPLISSVCALHLYNSSALLPSSYSTKDEIIKRGPRNDYVYEDIDPEWKSCLQSWSLLTFHTQKKYFFLKNLHPIAIGSIIFLWTPYSPYESIDPMMCTIASRRFF